MVYNDDYVSTTKRYLKDYKKKKTALSNLKEELKEKTELQGMDVNASIAKYGTEPGGGYSELNAVEKATEISLQLSKDIYNLLSEVGELTKHIKRIDTALDSLPEDSKQILTYRYIDGYTWSGVSDRAYISERKARYICENALQATAYMLFGSRATNGDREYVFLK